MAQSSAGETASTYTAAEVDRAGGRLGVFLKDGFGPEEIVNAYRELSLHCLGVRSVSRFISSVSSKRTPPRGVQRHMFAFAACEGGNAYIGSYSGLPV
jgi:hypothetical protein